MLTVGFIFQSELPLLLAMISLTTLGATAVIFRKQSNVLRKNISATIDPAWTATLENVAVKFSVAITNSSQISTRLVKLHPTLPTQVEGVEMSEVLPKSFPGNSTLVHEMTAQAVTSGLFTVSSVTATIEDRSTLFIEAIRLGCRWVLEASPTLTFAPVRMETTDPRRAGSVSDIAGVREAVSIDDFRTIDWKTTARTGKFMAKQFYRESTPPAIIAVDKEVLIEGIRSNNDALLTVAELLISFAHTTRIGLAIYDANRVLVYFIPTTGARALQQMVSALVNATVEDIGQPGEYVTRRYTDLASMVRGMKSTATLRAHQSIDVFARDLLPYYENSLANHALKLRKQGGFEALSTISTFPQPALVIVISGSSHDLSGLCEGVLTTSAAGHYVVVSVISGAESLSPELSELRQTGILVVQDSGPQLLSAISKGLQKVQRIKSRTVKTR